MSQSRNTGLVPSRTRRIARVVSAVGTAALAGGLAFLAACADAPSGPRPGLAPQAPSLELVSPSVLATGLLRDVALQQNITVSAKIGSAGGTLSIPEAGLKLIVPAGAVKKPTTFTATALAGPVVAYDFGPSGSFPHALTVSQDLKGTNWYKVKPENVEGAYVRDLTTIDAVAGTARVDEFLPAAVDVGASKLRFEVRHFSGYMVSTGRSRNSAY